MHIKRQTLGLIGWLTAAFAAGGIGASASIDAAAFYATLNTPPWAPPASHLGGLARQPERLVAAGVCSKEKHSGRKRPGE